jgi:glycerophosphoryl diester phosphodiesterase
VRTIATHPFLPERPPVAIAHRGGAEEAPENTLEAFGAAIALGYRYVETDAHVTRDGAVVAFHDDHLEDGRAIADVASDEVDAPRLEELLTRWPDARVNIDPKADDTVEPLLALLDRLGAWDRVCLGAFSDRRLRRIRAHTGGRACTSMGPAAVATARAAALIGRMPRLGARCLQVPIRWGRTPIVTAGFVRAAHRSGLHVHVWTVDDPATMHRLLDLGVDGIMTDRPAILKDVLVRRSAWVT